MEVVQEHIQSCFFILDGGFRREAGAATFGGHEVTDIFVPDRYIEPQEQFIFRILRVVVAVIAFTKAYPSYTDRASFTDEILSGIVHMHSPSSVIDSESPVCGRFAPAIHRANLHC
jgi:hypothetical protein